VTRNEPDTLLVLNRTIVFQQQTYLKNQLSGGNFIRVIDSAYFRSMKILSDPDSGKIRFNTSHPFVGQGRYFGFLFKHYFLGSFYAKNRENAFSKYENIS
jgi:hypothetical protein